MTGAASFRIRTSITKLALVAALTATPTAGMCLVVHAGATPTVLASYRLSPAQPPVAPTTSVPQPAPSPAPPAPAEFRQQPPDDFNYGTDGGGGGG
ncbi:hypothetical protein [Mycobacterium shigaense]|uniref:Uncharacterized protein n=1 Tax=Mycobacterium shigaense TaxID=722731 RepID=A0A1Z4EJE2_9MYCO|nr:hypothetical protein [Mycobacterium shigaense]MEA1124857.1 hypothetical protein [Mycobacterium shigaense]BAX93084.1 hypothetical protein MSG_02943 [Mycobacterium shigaense]